MAEHLESKSTGGCNRPDGSPCIIIGFLAAAPVLYPATISIVFLGGDGELERVLLEPPEGQPEQVHDVVVPSAPGKPECTGWPICSRNRLCCHKFRLRVTFV